MDRQNSLTRYNVLLLLVFIYVTLLYESLPAITAFTNVNLVFVFYLAFIMSYLGYVIYRKVIVFDQNLLFMIFFFIYCLIISIINKSYYLGFHRVVLFLLYGAILFIIVQIVNNRRQIDYLIHATLFLFVSLIVIAVLEIFTGIHLPSSRLSEPNTSRRLASTIYHNRNNFGFFLSTLAPLYVYNTIAYNKDELRFSLEVGFIFIGLIILLINSSRTAFISYVVSSIIVVVLYYSEDTDYPIKMPHRAGSIIYLSYCMLHLIVPIIITNPFESSGLSSLYTRWELISSGIEYIYASGFEPTGLNLYSDIISGTGSDELPTTPHNWVIQLGVETGIFGLTIFILAIGLLTDRLISLYNSGRSNWALPLAVILITFPFSGVGPSDVLYQAQIFWVVIAICILVSIYSSTEAISDMGFSK